MTRKFLTPIVLPADPAAAMEASTKQYVDGKVAASGAFPAGGVLGDILVKQSATNGDATWGTVLPTLRLTATNALRFGSTTGPLIASDGTFINLISNGNIYYDVSNSGTHIWRRTSDYLTLMSLNSTGTLVTAAGAQINGMTTCVNAGTLEQIRFSGDASFLSGYNAAQSTRRGYLQFNNGNVTLNAEAGGILSLTSSGRCSFNPSGGGESVFIDSGGVRMQGSNSVYWSAYGGGWYMLDGSYMRSYNDKHIWAGNGLIGCNGGFAANTSVISDANAGFYSMNKNCQINFNMAAGVQSWGYCQFRAISNVGGNTGIAAITFNPANAGVAPIWWCYGGAGEVLSANNNTGNGAIPIYASAFTVQSTLRVKEDVVPFSDEVVLEHARRVKGIRYRLNYRPQALRPTVEFLARKALDDEVVMLADDQMSFDHDCDLDPCNGTHDNPCCIALNDTPVYGFAAEELIDVLPEVVKLDDTRTPYGIDIAQVASLALAAVGALTRRVDELERKLR